MKFRVDFQSYLCIEVEAKNDDEAAEIAQQKLLEFGTMRQLAGNADITGIDWDGDFEDQEEMEDEDE